MTVLALLAGCGRSDLGDGAPAAGPPVGIRQTLLSAAAPRVGIVGHRGAKTRLLPGNSMASFARAARLGIRCVETDVRLSSDGVPFIVHSLRFRPSGSVNCTGRSVSEMTAKQIDRCILWPTVSEHVPTLGALLEWARGRMMLQLDVKQRAAIPTTIREIISRHAEDVAYLSVTPWEATRLVRPTPGSERIYLSLRARNQRDVNAALVLSGQMRVLAVEVEDDLYASVASTSRIRTLAKRVHRAGLRLMLSSSHRIASEEDYQGLFAQGFDTVMAYSPARGAEAAREFNQRTAAQAADPLMRTAQNRALETSTPEQENEPGSPK